MKSGKQEQMVKLLHILLWFTIVNILIGAVQGQYRSPRITEHPKDVLVKKNEPTTLNCKSEGKPEPVIEWYKDGLLLDTKSASNDGRRIFLPGGDLFFLSVSDGKKESDSGIYWCIARNGVGSVRSRNASLQVGVIRDEFQKKPQNTKALMGETVTLQCQAPIGTPQPQIIWHKNGQNTETRILSNRVYTVDGGNLVIKDVRASDAGRYACLAINIAGQRQTPEISLIVQEKPHFITKPEDTVVLIGDNADFLCEAKGLPAVEIQWFRQDAGMPSGRAERIDGSSLRIRKTIPEDEGYYFCQASNELGSVRASALLTVQARPEFMIRPRDTKVGLNGIVKLECSASGSPSPFIYWRKEGSSQELLFPSTTHINGRLQITPEGTLRIQGVKKEDSGIYICTALSEAGSRDTQARLDVTSHDQIPPPIIRLGPTNQTLPYKSVAAMPCSCDASSVKIKWLKNGLDLSKDTVEVGEGKRISISLNGTLKINDLRSTDSATYTCIASGVSGETSASGYLLVESPTNPNIPFHRTNPALLPPSPTQPILVNETQQNSITLSWTWVGRIGGPSRNQPLLGFTLELFSPDIQNSWRTIGTRIYGGMRIGEVVVYTVDGLKADTSYVFLVRAENPEGYSLPSPISEPIRTGPLQRSRSDLSELNEEEARNQLASSEIELISAQAASSTSIRISWKVSKSAVKFIDGYFLRYREISENQQEQQQNNQPFALLTVVTEKDDFDAYSHVIPSLRKYTQYQVFVAPFYKSVEGQPSNLKSLKTSQDSPSEPPQNLSTKMINATAASLHWSPPPIQNINGILKGYRVEVKGNDSVKHAEIDFSNVTTSVVLNNLTMGREYHVRVTAFTSVGLGPYTPVLVIVMDLNGLLLDDDSEEYSGIATNQDGLGGGGASEILKEVWFIILMGCLLFIFLLLLIIILYSRRKSHGKKDHHISSVVVAPHHPHSDFVSSGKQSLWIDQRWRTGDASDKDSNRSEAKLLANHNTMIMGDPNDGTEPDQNYAEVDPHSLTTFYNNCSKAQIMQMQMAQQQPDLTPYATTTLIQRRPNYDGPPTLPPTSNGSILGKNIGDDSFSSSGRSKLSLGSNNFSKFKTTHSSPSPSPAPLKMIPMTSRMGCYPSPGANRSQFDQHPSYQPTTANHFNPLTSQSHANENLYHIGEIFSSKSNNGFAEAVYTSGDPDDNNFLGQQSLCPLIDREIQSSLPSLDSNSCNLYAEADDILPQTTGNNYILGGRLFHYQHQQQNPYQIHQQQQQQPNNHYLQQMQQNTQQSQALKNSRSTSPAYSSDSFNSGKSTNARLYNKANKKKFENACKSLERRHLAPLLPPGRGGEELNSQYSRPQYPELNGFQKLARFGKSNLSQGHLDNNGTVNGQDWQYDPSQIKFLNKETNA